MNAAFVIGAGSFESSPAGAKKFLAEVNGGKVIFTGDEVGEK